MTLAASVSYGCQPENVSRARSWLRDQLAYAGPTVSAAVADDAELVLSELVTNALKAGCSSVDLRLGLEPDSLHIGVRDDAPGVPTPRVADSSATSGRGLPIVGALAVDWGVRRMGTVKETWATVALPPAG